MPHSSSTTTLPSAARSDSAEQQRQTDHLLRRLLGEAAGLGPRATPPPRQCGDRIEPCRARPVPFWRHGLAPPPATSARVRVLCEPARRAASCAVTTWCMTGTFGSRPKMSLGEIGRADDLAGPRPHVDRRHQLFTAFTASRMITSPPFGPGTAPFTRSRSCSASADTTSRLRVVTR